MGSHLGGVVLVGSRPLVGSHLGGSCPSGESSSWGVIWVEVVQWGVVLEPSAYSILQGVLNGGELHVFCVRNHTVFI